MLNRSYSELIKLKTFRSRYEYLRLKDFVGRSTFGFDRHLNQAFYHSTEWLNVRDFVIVRDDGLDLGIPGYEITDKLVVHHMNPITPDELIHGDQVILDPETLICTSYRTHLAIHYGDESLLPKPLVVRRAGDTTLW